MPFLHFLLCIWSAASLVSCDENGPQNRSSRASNTIPDASRISSFQNSSRNRKEVFQVSEKKNEKLFDESVKTNDLSIPSPEVMNAIVVDFGRIAKPVKSIKKVRRRKPRIIPNKESLDKTNATQPKPQLTITDRVEEVIMLLISWDHGISIKGKVSMDGGDSLHDQRENSLYIKTLSYVS